LIILIGTGDPLFEGCLFISVFTSSDSSNPNPKDKLLSDFWSYFSGVFIALFYCISYLSDFYLDYFPGTVLGSCIEDDFGKFMSIISIYFS